MKTWREIIGLLILWTTQEALASGVSTETLVGRPSLDLTTQLSSSLHPLGSVEHQASLDLILDPQVPVTESLKLIGRIWASQGLTAERKFELQDATVGVTTRSALPISTAIAYTPTVSALLPASFASREEASLRAAMGTTQKLTWKIAAPLSASYRLGLTRYFHEFESNVSGKSNAQWRVLHRADLNWGISEKLSLALVGIVSSYWSYAGNPWSTFEGTQELSYQWTEAVSVALGHTHSGNAFKPNGMDSNVELFNSESSTVYGRVTVAF